MIHGTTGLALAYLLVLAALWTGLFRARASATKFLLSPLFAAPLLLVVALLNSLLMLIFGGEHSLGHSWLQIAIGGCVALGLSYGAGSIWAWDTSGRPRHRRGAVVAPDTGLEKPRTDPGADKTCIHLAGIPVSLADETKHFKLVGTTGTGKSTAIREILSTALGRGDRAVIADPDGGYLANFYDPSRGDVILNPFDFGAAKWDLFGEIANDYDVEQLARSLITDNGASDKSWTGYARTFFTCVVQQCLAARVKDGAEVYRLITSASVEELRLLLARTPAGPFLEEGNDRMFGSLRSVTSSAVSALKYTTRQQAAAFSIRRWIAQSTPGRGGVLFLPYKAAEIAALRSIISAWMRIAIFEAMDRLEGDHRLWFVIDELDALGEIDGLKDALARLRKFGGRCLLGFQSISQVSSTYGKGVADTIVENCGNTLILRCSASEQGGTSQFASRLIGQREVIHIAHSKTSNPRSWLPSRTTSEQRAIEPAVMASEIERLADFEGYLKLASQPDWRKVLLKHVSYPIIHREKPPSVPDSTLEETKGNDSPAPARRPRRKKSGS